MSRRYLGVTGIALLAVLAFPSAGHASIWDLIWTLSGPQMIGGVFHCEYDWQHSEGTYIKDGKEVPVTFVECRIVDRLIVGHAQSRRLRRTWLTFDTGAYTSTGKNSDGFDFEAFENHMIAFEPMVEIRSYTTNGPDGQPNMGNLSLHHGLLGASYNVLFGSRFDTFDKIGFKFRPIGITYKSFNAAFNIRWYPNGFTADEFGMVGPRIDDFNRPSETLWGFSMGYIWGPR